MTLKLREGAVWCMRLGFTLLLLFYIFFAIAINPYESKSYTALPIYPERFFKNNPAGLARSNILKNLRSAPIKNISTSDPLLSCEDPTAQKINLYTLKLDTFCECSNKLSSLSDCRNSSNKFCREIPGQVFPINTWEGRSFCVSYFNEQSWTFARESKCPEGFSACSDYICTANEEKRCPINNIFVSNSSQPVEGSLIYSYNDNYKLYFNAINYSLTAATSKESLVDSISRRLNQAVLISMGVTLSSAKCTNPGISPERANMTNYSNLISDKALGCDDLGDESELTLNIDSTLYSEGQFYSDSGAFTNFPTYENFEQGIQSSTEKVLLYGSKKLPVNPACQSFEFDYDFSPYDINRLVQLRKGAYGFGLFFCGLAMIVYVFHVLSVSEKQKWMIIESVAVAKILSLNALFQVFFNASAYAYSKRMRDDYEHLSVLADSFCISSTKYNTIYTDYYKEILSLNLKYIRELEEFTKANLYFAIVLLILLNLYFHDKFDFNYVFSYSQVSPIDEFFLNSRISDKKKHKKKSLFSSGSSFIRITLDDFI